MCIRDSNTPHKTGPPTNRKHSHDRKQENNLTQDVKKESLHYLGVVLSEGNIVASGDSGAGDGWSRPGDEAARGDGPDQGGNLKFVLLV